MKLLDLDQPPTAIFADDLVLMTGALHALHERRISCPADLEVMSSDDAEWLDVFSPPISTVVQPAYELGEIAATLLMKRIKHPRREYESILLQPKLRVRGQRV